MADYQGSDAGEEAHRQHMLDFLTSTPNAFLRSHLAGHMTASALVLDHEQQACLLLLHRKLERWLQPGGHADGDEDLEAVARREVAEETGLEQLELLERGIFDVDVHLIPARKEVPEHFHYDVRFLFRAVHPEAIVGNHESEAVAWVPLEEVPARAGEESILRMVRKVQRM